MNKHYKHIRQLQIGMRIKKNVGWSTVTKVDWTSSREVTFDFRLNVEKTGQQCGSWGVGQVEGAVC